MISRQVSEIYMYYNVACGSSDFTNTDHVCLKNLQNFVPLLRCSVRWCGTLPNFKRSQRESNETSDRLAEQERIELSWQVAQSRVIPF